MKFKKAEKSKSKLRLAIFGPSGSGKTYSSLAIASGIGKKVALIDTERSSASLYADMFSFDTMDLPKKDIKTYIEAIKEAGQADYDILIIDSLTHAWKDLLGEVDRLAKTKYRGNSWAAWSEGTPLQTSLVDALLDFPGHIIGTMRTKTEWTTETGRDGKIIPVRVGLIPEQGKGIEYEFTLLMELNVNHIATIIKDRTGLLQDQLIEKPGKGLGHNLLEWLEKGIEIKPIHWSEDEANRVNIEKRLAQNAIPIGVLFDAHNIKGWDNMINVEGTGRNAYNKAKEWFEKQTTDIDIKLEEVAAALTGQDELG